MSKKYPLYKNTAIFEYLFNGAIVLMFLTVIAVFKLVTPPVTVENLPKSVVSLTYFSAFLLGYVLAFVFAGQWLYKYKITGIHAPMGQYVLSFMLFCATILPMFVAHINQPFLVVFAPFLMMFITAFVVFMLFRWKYKAQHEADRMVCLKADIEVSFTKIKKYSFPLLDDDNQLKCQRMLETALASDDAGYILKTDKALRTVTAIGESAANAGVVIKNAKLQ
ncbi:MAG: hypothetical protein ACI9TY_000735 [Alphaproteobacteria bacterium]|jgi:hypothetical protein